MKMSRRPPLGDHIEDKQDMEDLKLYAAVARFLAEGVQIVRADGTILYANRKFEELFGYAPGELKGKPVSILNASNVEDAEGIAQEIFQTLASQGAWYGRLLNRRKNGSEFWSEAHVTAYAHPHFGQVWLTVQWDITKQMLGEQAVIHSERRLNSVIEVMQEGIWDWNLSRGIAYLSPQYYALTGYQEGEVTPDYEFFKSLVHEEDWPTVQAAMTACLEGRTPFSDIEYRMRTKAGEWRWISGRGRVVERADDGKPLRMLGAIQDITERNQAMAKLEEHRLHLEETVKQRSTELLAVQDLLRMQKERLELALSSSNLGTWDVDRVTGKAIHDARYCAQIGYRPEEFPPDINGWLDRLHPDDVEAVMAGMKAHDRGESENFHMEYRVKHKDGHWVWIDSFGRIVSRDADGTPLRIVGTTRDVTAQKRMKDEGTELLKRIEAMMNDIVIGQDAQSRSGRDDRRNVIDELPRRQRQILIMIAQGMTSAEIGERLQLGTATVITHRRALMKRLDLHTTAELTRFAIAHDLLKS
ncbi:MAG TPA: PAS domain-containing protein [Rhodocyclaceae bacterium]|nr:PAS domain-containing protein [Rhodocyclaceae bacterium]